MSRISGVVLGAAFVLGLAACGSSTSPGSPAHGTGDQVPSPVSCPAGGDLLTAADILPELLPDADTLYAWQSHMVGLGPRFDGSPALKSWHDFLADKLAGYGLSVQREPMPIDWWYHRKWSLTLTQGGIETVVPVASYYPYSGHTPEGGVVGDVVNVGKGLATDFLLADVSGKIAFFEVDLLPLTLALFYADASYVHDPDMTMSPLTDFKKMSLSILTPQLSILTAETRSLGMAKSGGAIGAIISLEASAENAAGQYTPFNGHPGASFDVPALYVDRATGNLIKEKIALGAQARLELVVDEHMADTTDDIIATLPGTNPDEVVIFNTHTDGMSSAEENGGIGVLAMAQYFASLPQECRKRTMVFVLTPGHMHGGIGGDTDRFIRNHPEIISKAVASLTMEHLGQTEWLDDATGFHATGLVEPAVFFGSPAPAIQAIMANAVVAEDLRRVIVSRPIAVIYFGVGSPLNLAGVPNAGYLTGPHMLYSFADNQHLDKVDRQRMAAEVRTFARVGMALDATDTTTLCAGMLPSTSLTTTGCGLALGVP